MVLLVSGTSGTRLGDKNVDRRIFVTQMYNITEDIYMQMRITVLIINQIKSWIRSKVYR